MSTASAALAEDSRVERQELYCHNCGKYVQFDIDLSLNGNHVLKCPNCGHEHCRVVKDGKITGDRWDSRNDDSVQTWYVNQTNVTWTASSTWTTYTSTSSTTSSYIYGLWMDYNATK